jgi:L-lactate dehydrogenase complex protein LldG
MTAAKEAILGRIRAVDRGAPAAVERSYRRVGDLETEARTRLFADRVADYRAEVRLVGAPDVATAIASALDEHGAVRVAAPAGLPHAWRPAACELVEDGGLSPHELDALDGVVTGCTVAIAETGTIVLTGGATEGRRALSLVPDLHVCVVLSRQIVELVTEAIEPVGGLVARERRPITLIAGPSATSDIELSRVEGVHGPRTLIVLIVKEEVT